MYSKTRLSFMGYLWLSVLCVSFVGMSLADEGMWTFDNPPTKQLKERYGFTPTQEWLDHVRLSSVRFNNGGSGSFISPNGLIMTNHHVAVGQLQKISTDQHDYVVTGFYAATPADDLKCPDLELNVLQSMEDVTARVRAAVKPGMSDSDALKARQAEIANIERESLDKTGLRSNVINLYHDGEYWLYRYKRYTDVRLVMAPERQAAYYGGDYDNFTYPRYDLDMAFFRAYENGQPVHPKNYFKWNSKGAAENELVFVSGNPGSTDRLYTYSQLEYSRDYEYPMILKYIKERIRIAREYAKAGQEQQRRALVTIFGLENAKKAYTGEYEGLLDEQLMAKRQQQEQDFRKLVDSKADLRKTYGSACNTIAQTVELDKKSGKEHFYERIMGSSLAGFAQTIVRYVAEVQKNDADRLQGYHDSDLESLKYRLFSPAPVYPDMEEATLAGTLQMSLQELGPNDPFIKMVLNGQSPEKVAKELVEGTKLADVAYRKSLVEGGQKAVEASTDPMIVLARKIDPFLRENEEKYRKNIESVISAASEKIAKARFAVYGKTTYPDATFTLRLSYGAVKGYPMNGTIAPYKTTIYGLYDRSASFDDKGDFKLPERFLQRRDQLDMSTPVDFVSTCDIIGGNSGSPVINRNAEVVGLIFDGNIESLPGRFVYDETRNRAVAVHTAYFIEALRKLYDAGSLADEIEGK